MRKKLLPVVLLLAGAVIGLQSMAAEFTVANIQKLNIALSKLKLGDVIIWRNGQYKDVNKLCNFFLCVKG